MTASFGRAAPAVLALMLAVMPVLVPAAAADQVAVDFRPIPDLSGAQAALRLYGCTDALGSQEAPVLASGLAGGPPDPNAPDGRLDCAGDQVHLGSAFLASAADPFYRSALGPRDQTVAARLEYRPATWFPGPSHPRGVADPVDPAKGLFDRDDDGVLDLAPPQGTPYTDEGAPRPVDLAVPRDNLPDAAPRGDDEVDSDRYFSAIEASYRFVWTAGSNGPVPLPAGASFVFPFASNTHQPGLDDWTAQGRPSATYWHPTPFGTGSGQDGIGALHTAPLTLGIGDEAWFLDHGIRVVGFFGTTESARVAVEVLFDGPDGHEVLASSLILTPMPEDPARHATIDRAAAAPSNVVFADRTGIDRNVPPFHDENDPARDAAWFAVAGSVSGEEGPSKVSLRIGRLVSAEAPWNAFVADKVLYRFGDLVETAGSIERLAVAALHPLGDPVELRSAGLRLRGVANTEPLPFLPPFNAGHTVLDDLDPQVVRDERGFLQAAGGGSTIAADRLALRPDAASPSERARPAERLMVQWRATGSEQRFAVPVVGIDGDTALTFGALLPANYLELVLPDGRYRVDSVLLDDAATLSQASDAPGSPRGFRSFVFDPRDPQPLFVGADGLRLFSGTPAHPDAGDRVVFDPALLRREAFGGRIQTPAAFADEVVRLQLSHQAMRTVPGLGVPQAAGPDGGPVDGSQGVHDHLWDVADDSAAPRPMLEARYAFSFVDHATLEALAPPLGPRTALLVPAVDRDPGRPGLDSFDMDGDGTPDEVVVRGYWDMDRGGTARERLITGGAYRTEGNASTADMLWLRSRPLTIGIGQEARFFDHGVRFQGGRVGPGNIAPSLDLLDLREQGPRLMGNVDDIDATGRGCVPVDWEGLLGGSRSCGDLQLASPIAGVPPSDSDTKWWVEVEAASEHAVTVVLNRVFTHIDRDATGDERLMLVGGGLYRWETPAFQDGVLGSLSVSQLVPLDRPLELDLPGGLTVRVDHVLPGGLVPVLPPFAATHQKLQLNDVAVERNEYGFLDSRGDPGDPDAVLAARRDRVDTVAGISIHYEGQGREARHHFVMLDPTKAWDPERRGTAFVNGIFAVPGEEGPFRDAAVPGLRTDGPDGFEEAIRTADDRGWDEYAIINVDGVDRVVVDSARLGRPWLTARVVDQAPGAAAAPHPNELAWWTDAPRGAGMWLWQLHAPADLYVVPLDAGPGRSPSPSPVGLPDRTASPSEPWPTRSIGSDGGTKEGAAVEGGGLLVLFIAVAAVLHIVRRRR